MNSIEQNDGCKMTLVMNGVKLTWETRQWDCSVEDLLHAFYGLCVGQTFVPESVLRGMKNFVEEHSDISVPDELES